MTRVTLEWIETVKQKFGLKHKKVLDIGSMDMNGSPRPLFKDCEYVGIDIQAGVGVDMILDARQDMTKELGKETFDAILCLNTLEHIGLFWKALENIWEVLSPKGYFYLAVPTFGFPQHKYPGDYWRFSEGAIKNVIMRDYEILDYEEVKTKFGKNPIINCLGVK